MAIKRQITELKIEILPAANVALQESNDGYPTVLVYKEVKFYGTGVDENDTSLPKYDEEVVTLRKYSDYPNETDLSNETPLVRNVCTGAWA